MLLKTIEHPGAAIIHVQGRIDSETVPELEHQVLGMLTGDRRYLVLDFSELDYINSAGLRVLLVAAKQARAANGQLALATLRDNPREVFDISGFSAIFAIHPSLEQALAALA